MRMIKPPVLDWTKILAGGLIYIGYLMFLIVLHILTINNGGNTAAVLNTAYSVPMAVGVEIVVVDAVTTDFTSKSAEQTTASPLLVLILKFFALLPDNVQYD